MYQLVKEPVAWIDIDWTGLETGGPEEASVQVDRSLRMKVRFLPRTELIDMLEGNVSKPLNELAVEVCRDWSGVVDEDKRAIPFSVEMLESIIENEGGFATGFEISYLKAAMGQGKVREKNLDGSPGDGRAAAKAGKKPAPPTS